MHTLRIKNRLFIPVLAVSLLLLSAGVQAAGKVDKILSVEKTRIQRSAKSQQKINRESDKAADLLSSYKNVTKVIEGLVVYNRLLQKQLDGQNKELDQLGQSINNVSLIERQIVPLMVRMIDSLDQFIKLDIPFLPKERTTRIARLKKMMERSDVTTAEKFRRVLEAYQIENDYGRTIEAYKGTVKIAGKQREVNFLRIGRTVLIYQTLNRKHTGMWDQQAKTWKALPSRIYRNTVSKGLKVARKQIAPDLLILPIEAAEDAQ